MRIIAGEMRSRTILAPKGTDTRPTLDRTRESLFNIIAAWCPDARVLDLYAGSGALALEAISRGAQSAVLCDSSREAARVIKANIEALRVQDRARLLPMMDSQALALLGREGARFDLVFLDPPYASGLLESVLPAVAPHVNDGGLIVCETDGDTALPMRVDRFYLSRARRYGRVCLRFYRFGEGEDV